MATPPDFTAGQILTAAQMNAVGLWLVKTETVGSAVSSVQVTGAFSADYDSYKVVYSGGVGSSSNAQLSLTFGSTSTGYEYGWGIANGIVASPGFYNASGSFITVGDINTDIIMSTFDVINPNLAKHTFVSGGGGINLTNGQSRGPFNGLLKNTTQYTAFTLTPSAGTITGGTIRVYGYRN
jgi:hypothetical protein